MSRLKSFGVIVALLAFGGCSSTGIGCGCPVAGPKLTLFASKGQLNFANIGSAYSQTVTLTASKGKDGTVTEIDNCMTAAGSIVSVQIPTTETPLTVVVTPMMSGSCSIQFSTSTGGVTNVSIDVSPAG
jgi:hypothetical protein